MVLKKQTVWLLTMLTLMVVLSAYYLMNDDTKIGNQAEMNSKNLLDALGEANNDLNFTNADKKKDKTNFFLSYRLERDTHRAKMVDEFNKVLASAEASAEIKAEANASMNKMYDMAEAEYTLESLIQAEGYEEAVVIADEDRVNVIVKSQKALQREQVLNIIHLVKNHLKVPGNQVFVSFR